MNVVVAGCGRVGAGLAGALDAAGEDVAVIDVDPTAFRRLPEGFGGRTVQGIAFDRATLLRADVEQADAFVAVTSGDNSNVVSARTARISFGVETVVARIYDPERAEIYERYGITTIATTSWATDAVLAHLSHGDATIESGIGPGQGDVVVIGHDLPAEGGPWDVDVFQRQGRWLLAAVTRTGQTTVPVPRQLLQPGERIHLSVLRAAVPEAQAFLAGLADGTGSSGDDHVRRG
jgi:trk system potassium uptake protein